MVLRESLSLRYLFNEHSHTMKYIIITSAFFVALIACHGDKKQATHTYIDSLDSHIALAVDTSYVILQADTIHPVTLSSEEIMAVDTLLLKCIKQYELFEPGKYQRQFVPSTNAKGEKCVWVNCFCREGDQRWRKEIIIVKDGGKCYFQVTINLTTQTFSNVSINGLG